MACNKVRVKNCCVILIGHMSILINENNSKKYIIRESFPNQFNKFNVVLNSGQPGIYHLYIYILLLLLY